jgi:predicted RNase H-like nuclease (RuvC/YqgF family)
MAHMEEQIKALDKELREMASAIGKISSSLFEGGANSVVAIALRYSQQAENYVDRRQVTALEDRIKALESKLEEEKTQIKLRRTEFWLALFSRLGFWGITALFLMIFAAIIGVDRAIDLLKALIAK